MSLARPTIANIINNDNNNSLSKDMALPADAEDTISSVSWLPTANHLAAASWDGRVVIYDVAANGSARAAAMLVTDGPVLSCDWAEDGTAVIAGGADRKVHLLHLHTGQHAAVGYHDGAIRSVRSVQVPGSNCPIIASGSWDKTVKFWDARQQNPLATLACAERVYAMDAKARLLVMATAQKHIHLVDLHNPTSIYRTAQSPLKCQTKSVAAFPDGTGWATVSIEGRCGIEPVIEEQPSVGYQFKCHHSLANARRVTKVYTVNDVQFHPVYTTTLSTAGSDGAFHFYDRVARAQISPTNRPSAEGPITTTSFNRDGSLYAYAVGYDWSQGHSANTPQYPNKLMLHSVAEE